MKGFYALIAIVVLMSILTIFGLRYGPPLAEPDEDRLTPDPERKNKNAKTGA